MMKHTKTLRPPSCKAWRDAGHTTDGLYTIYPGIESGDETLQLLSDSKRIIHSVMANMDPENQSIIPRTSF